MWTGAQYGSRNAYATGCDRIQCGICTASRNFVVQTHFFVIQQQPILIQMKALWVQATTSIYALCVTVFANAAVNKYASNQPSRMWVQKHMFRNVRINMCVPCVCTASSTVYICQLPFSLLQFTIHLAPIVIFLKSAHFIFIHCFGFCAWSYSNCYVLFCFVFLMVFWNFFGTTCSYCKLYRHTGTHKLK